MGWQNRRRTGGYQLTSGKAKRDFMIHGRATSIALEPAIWSVIETMAQTQNVSIAYIVARAYENRIDPKQRVASILREMVVNYLLNKPIFGITTKPTEQLQLPPVKQLLNMAVRI